MPCHFFVICVAILRSVLIEGKSLDDRSKSRGHELFFSTLSFRGHFAPSRTFGSVYRKPYEQNKNDILHRPAPIAAVLIHAAPFGLLLRGHTHSQIHPDFDIPFSSRCLLLFPPRYSPTLCNREQQQQQRSPQAVRRMDKTAHKREKQRQRGPQALRGMDKMPRKRERQR